MALSRSTACSSCRATFATEGRPKNPTSTHSLGANRAKNKPAMSAFVNAGARRTSITTQMRLYSKKMEASSDLFTWTKTNAKCLLALQVHTRGNIMIATPANEKAHPAEALSTAASITP